MSYNMLGRTNSLIERTNPIFNGRRANRKAIIKPTKLSKGVWKYTQVKYIAFKFKKITVNETTNAAK